MVLKRNSLIGCVFHYSALSSWQQQVNFLLQILLRLDSCSCLLEQIKFGKTSCNYKSPAF